MKNKKNYLSSLISHLSSPQRGFTLIELMIVLSITAVLGVLSIPGFTTYNQIQVLQSATSELTNTLNLARSRALSQIKPPVCADPLRLDGYSVAITSRTTYTLNAKCSNILYLLKTTTLPNNIRFVTRLPTIFFPVLGGKVEGAGTIYIFGYERIKTIVISESGIFASAIIPTPNTTPAPTSTPTPTPTITPTPILVAGRDYKRVFVTSTTYNGDLKVAANLLPPPDVASGLAGGDKICQTLANVAKLVGTWSAWLSDGNTSAVQRLTHSTIPYRRIDVALIANDWADLTKGWISNAIFKNENSNVSTGSVWTGTRKDGTSSGSNCSNWNNDGTVNVFDSGEVGSTGEIGSNWTQGSFSSCNGRNRLYCFEVPIVPTPTPAPTATPTPTPAPKRVFVTSTSYNGDLKSAANSLPGPSVPDGLTAGDKLCQVRADAKNLGGKWTAWLSTTLFERVNAKDRLVGNHSYSRLDNQLVATSKADLIDGTLSSPIVIDETGDVPVPPNNFVWTGTWKDGTVLGSSISSSTCDDWTASQFGLSEIGNSRVFDGTWTSFGSDACWKTFRLYCFEQ